MIPFVSTVLVAGLGLPVGSVTQDVRPVMSVESVRVAQRNVPSVPYFVNLDGLTVVKSLEQVTTALTVVKTVDSGHGCVSPKAIPFLYYGEYSGETMTKYYSQ